MYFFPDALQLDSSVLNFTSMSVQIRPDRARTVRMDFGQVRASRASRPARGLARVNHITGLHAREWKELEKMTSIDETRTFFRTGIFLLYFFFSGSKRRHISSLLNCGYFQKAQVGTVRHLRLEMHHVTWPIEKKNGALFPWHLHIWKSNRMMERTAWHSWNQIEISSGWAHIAARAQIHPVSVIRVDVNSPSTLTITTLVISVTYREQIHDYIFANRLQGHLHKDCGAQENPVSLEKVMISVM